MTLLVQPIAKDSRLTLEAKGPFMNFLEVAEVNLNYFALSQEVINAIGHHVAKEQLTDIGLKCVKSKGRNLLFVTKMCEKTGLQLMQFVKAELHLVSYTPETNAPLPTKIGEPRVQAETQRASMRR